MDATAADGDAAEETGDARPGARHRIRLTIAQSSSLLAILLVVCLAVMAAVGFRLMVGMDDTAEGWRVYDLEAATKSDALSDMRGHLGLGGVIDRYHQERQSASAETAAALARSLGLARANLGIYRDIAVLTAEEERAVAAIARFLDVVEQDAAGGEAKDFDECRHEAVRALTILNTHLTVHRARLTAATLEDIEGLQRLMAFGGGLIAVLVLGLAGAAVWFTRARIVGPLRRLVEDARRLARRDLDRAFQWHARDELGLLGRTLEDSRNALRGLFAAIEEKSRRLGESERRYAMAAAAANDGLWDWDLVGDQLYLSSRLRQMLHLDPDTDGGLGAVLAKVDDRDRQAVRSALARAEEGSAGDGFEVEFRTVPGAAEAAWVLLRGVVARDGDGRVVRLAGSASDIGDRKSYEARLVHQATHDFLTGLPNRAFLVRWLHDRQEAMRRGPRTELALLFLDLDGFKGINDSFGHAVGDRLLIATAERITGLLAEGEFAVRLGGDEFVVVVPGGQDCALARAGAVEAAFQPALRAGGLELRLGVSIGLAVDDGTGDDPDQLLRDADIALYRAKERGKGRTVLFDASLREAILIRSRLQRDLPRSLADGDVFLLYQPIVALPGGEVVGFEALVRWRHPELGIVSPARFIPIAEETGQILPLGRHVLEQAVAQLARWRRMAPGRGLTVNVNLSARQMWDEGYVDELLGFLARSRAEGLKIEVTESMTVTDHDQAGAILQRFRALGVPLCMDDFGTGYSSLSHLGDLPFDVLKIDKSFVSAAGTDPRRESLLCGIVDLAHRLGLSVVAEGIETETERAIVSRAGCDYGQGYLFARPLPADDAEALLRGPAVGVGP